MFKYLIFTLVFIGAILMWMFFAVGIAPIHEEYVDLSIEPHRVGDNSTSIASVRINAAYFVPSDKQPVSEDAWRQALGEVLTELSDFHDIQTQGSSALEYYIYPKPISGEFESRVYNTENTNNGNPRALISIGEEMERRLFTLGGDHHNDFKVNSPGVGEDTYTVMLILYEGVGASGGVIYESDLETAEEIAGQTGFDRSSIFIVDIESSDGFLLVNRDFISGRNTETGSSILAHEFYHALGIADEYAHSETEPSGDGLMGLGRFRPLRYTFLNDETTAQLGIK